MNKKIVISISVIGVLLLYLIVSRISISNLPKLPKWEGEADKILINRSTGPVKLTKKEGKWFVGEKEYPADPKAVSELLKKFKEFNIVDPVSKRGFYQRYDLTPDKNVEVIIKEKNSILRKIKLGKKGPTNRHTFVRINDKPGIYLAEGVFDPLLKKSVEDFRDKKIIELSKDAAAAFEITGTGRGLSFQRVKISVQGKGKKESGKKGKAKPLQKKIEKNKVLEKWIYTGNKNLSISKRKIESFLGLFAPLRASSYPDIKKQGLGRALCVIKVKAYNRDITLSLYQKRDDKYPALSSESPYIFTLDEWMAKRLLKKNLNDFLEKKTDNR